MVESQTLLMWLGEHLDQRTALMQGVARRWRQTPGRRPELRESTQSGLEGEIAYWKPQGAIVSTTSRALLQTLAKRRVPTVNVTMAGHDLAGARVCVDNGRIGRLAAEHVTERGYQNLGTVAIDLPWARQRESGFIDAAARYGHNVVPLAKARQPDARFAWSRLHRSDRVKRFVQTFEPPAAIFCCNDQFALRACEAAADLGIEVPDELALIGVDNNAMTCEFAPVPLSSIEIDFERIGYEAMSLLDRLVDGQPLPSKPVTLDAASLIPRRSTDSYAFDSEFLAQALRIIRGEALEGITVARVLQRVPVSRTWLEQQFAAQLNRSPGQEIRRIRMEHAHTLITQTNLPLTEITAQCGYAYLSHMSKAFKQTYEMTPRDCRKASA